jgi:hypothetical protein
VATGLGHDRESESAERRREEAADTRAPRVSGWRGRERTRAAHGPEAKAGLRAWGRPAGLKQRLGRRVGDGLKLALGRKGKEEGGGKKRKAFQISKTTQANEFKQKFEFKHSKQCTSMYATGNSYISLLN